LAKANWNTKNNFSKANRAFLKIAELSAALADGHQRLDYQVALATLNKL